MTLQVHLGSRSYPIYIEDKILNQLSGLIPERKYAIVTDSGVPEVWVKKVQDQLPDSFVITIPQGESSKSFPVYESVLKQLAENNLTRKDAVIAVGGGVPGDLAGFAAATYMRGIDFYNIPTTVLSQVDSSVGGKTAIDLGDLKNIVGAFWQPKAVFIDPDVLSTLPKRQVVNGLAEALKMGLVFDEDLVKMFETEDFGIRDKNILETIIARSIDLKRRIVEEDETEGGPRKLLNFGHTIGHAIEGSFNLDEYLHGECVGMGMLYFLEDPKLKKRVIDIERKLGLPDVPVDILNKDLVMNLLSHDKKAQASGVDVILVHKPGEHEIRRMSLEEIQQRLDLNPYI